MDISTPMLQSRDEVIAQMYDEIGPMVRNFSINHAEDRPSWSFEDYRQYCAMKMIEVWPRIPEGRNPKPYLHSTARHALLKLLRSQEPDALSLDNTLTPDNNETFADQLVDIIQIVDEA
ncbi:MAG TPA: sigma factor, partial [Ktedonobacteraceae bacterium]|nr:sigma factor [Ktedonobacteraceae bacterium]